MPATDRGQIENTIEELQAGHASEDIARIRSLTEQLQQASHALTQQMYQQQAGADGAPENGAAPGGDAGSDGSGSNGTGEEDVVEGEFRQV